MQIDNLLTKCIRTCLACIFLVTNKGGRNLPPYAFDSLFLEKAYDIAKGVIIVRREIAGHNVLKRRSNVSVRSG